MLAAQPAVLDGAFQVQATVKASQRPWGECASYQPQPGLESRSSAGNNVGGPVDRGGGCNHSMRRGRRSAPSGVLPSSTATGPATLAFDLGFFGTGVQIVPKGFGLGGATGYTSAAAAAAAGAAGHAAMVVQPQSAAAAQVNFVQPAGMTSSIGSLPGLSSSSMSPSVQTVNSISSFRPPTSPQFPALAVRSVQEHRSDVRSRAAAASAAGGVQVGNTSGYKAHQLTPEDAGSMEGSSNSGFPSSEGGGGAEQGSGDGAGDKQEGSAGGGQESGGASGRGGSGAGGHQGQGGGDGPPRRKLEIKKKFP